MSQIGQAWGDGASGRYETLAAQFRPALERIRRTAVSRDIGRLAHLAKGATAGSDFSKTGDAKVGSFSNRLRRNGDQWLLNGRKYDTTGSLFADWIHLPAADDEGEVVNALVSTRARGVTILNDRDGFGQSLTASGTVIFDASRAKPLP